VISVQLGDDGNKENIDLLGQQIRQIRMMKGMEVGAGVSQGKVAPITFQADSCYNPCSIGREDVLSNF